MSRTLVLTRRRRRARPRWPRSATPTPSVSAAGGASARSGRASRRRLRPPVPPQIPSMPAQPARSPRAAPADAPRGRRLALARTDRGHCRGTGSRGAALAFRFARRLRQRAAPGAPRHWRVLVFRMLDGATRAGGSRDPLRARAARRMGRRPRRRASNRSCCRRNRRRPRRPSRHRCPPDSTPPGSCAKRSPSSGVCRQRGMRAIARRSPTS